MVEQLPQHLIDVQPFDIQFRRYAHTMAQNGQRTLLVGANLRRPNLLKKVWDYHHAKLGQR